MFWQSSAEAIEAPEDKKEVEVPALSEDRKERRRKREERRRRREAEAKTSDDDQPPPRRDDAPLRTASLQAELLGLSARARLLAHDDGALDGREASNRVASHRCRIKQHVHPRA